jgi:hypothetical protein
MVKFIIPIPIFVPAVLVRLTIAISLFYRKKRYGYEFRRIKLNKGKPVGAKRCEDRYAIVDVEDYEKLIGYPWYAAKDVYTFYAQRKENGKTIKMHRQIMNPPPGFFVDHKNHNGLDNRKANLRIATRIENSCNRRRLKLGISKYKGVAKTKSGYRWFAYIGHKGKRIHLGSFTSEEDAAKAYDEAAKLLFGQFAFLNFDNNNRESIRQAQDRSAVKNKLANKAFFC